MAQSPTPTLSDVLADEWYDLPLELVSNIIAFANPLRRMDNDAYATAIVEDCDRQLQCGGILYIHDRGTVEMEFPDDETVKIIYAIDGIVVWSEVISGVVAYELVEDNSHMLMQCIPNYGMAVVRIKQ